LHRQLGDNKRQVDSLKQQVRQLEQLANMGTAAAMILHEVNNLLTPVGTYADLALRNPDDKALSEKALKRAKENCARATKIAEAVVAAAGGNNQQKQQVQIAKLVDDVFTCLSRDFSKDCITVKKEIDEGLTVEAVQVKLEQVIMNLVLNARQAMLETGGGTLSITAERRGDFIRIEVADTGCGMDKITAGRIFEPFFTTKQRDSESGRLGAGLGLAFCKESVEEYGGTISVETEPGAGSVFAIMLPCCGKR
jgi:C4-dicarboxylate-specific signal transduction histidine kinase